MRSRGDSSRRLSAILMSTADAPDDDSSESEKAPDAVPLAHCQVPGKPWECKAGFPKQNELVDETVLLCPGMLREIWGYRKKGVGVAWVLLVGRVMR